MPTIQDMDVLLRIKRLALFGRVEFTEKALFELELDGLQEDEVIESLVNAGGVLRLVEIQDERLHE